MRLQYCRLLEGKWQWVECEMSGLVSRLFFVDLRLLSYQIGHLRVLVGQPTKTKKFCRNLVPLI